MRKYMLYGFILYLFIGSCNDKINSLNKDDIVEFSLSYLLSNHNKFHLPVDYLNQPLSIIQTKGYLSSRKIYVNGFSCNFLPGETKAEIIMRNMNIFKPIPLVEIISVKLQNNIIHIDIILRATGHNFLMELKSNKSPSHYEVIKVVHRTI